jgi:ubiquinone/menaquinone biosynthesis C-methylase UbiE
MTSMIDEVTGARPAAPADADAIRARLHAMWDSVAPAWAEHADVVDARAAGLSERMLEATAPARDERVLELACGAGGLGLAAAERVAPDGEVVLSDVAPEMVAIAAARAAARGQRNVACRVLDLERIAEADAAYDVVLCREGLMFATDPGRAAAELARVLRPRGRVAVAVWGPKERNPWLAVVFDAASAELGRPVPPPGVPGPFALGEAGTLGRLLTAAGLNDVEVHEYEVPLRAPSIDAWWNRTTALAGPLAGVLAALPGPQRQALSRRVHAAAQPFAGPDGVEFPGLALLATARR